jgi:hypothetical protein
MGDFPLLQPFDSEKMALGKAGLAAFGGGALGGVR